jgi:hypothetical protein
MSTAHPVNHEVKSLFGRVLSFYESLSRGDAANCYRLIDPLTRGEVGREAYARSIASLHEHHGSLRIEGIDVRIMHGERAAIYKNREFAIVEVRWRDRRGDSFSHKGPWVKNGKSWYTRGVGFAPCDETVQPLDTARIPR